jgi:hypothetical protein
MKAEAKRQSNGPPKGGFRPPVALSPARQRLSALIAAQKQPPDPKLTSLLVSVDKAKTEEAQAAQAFETSKTSNKDFDVDRRSRCEQRWVRATAVLEEAQAALRAHQSKLPDGAIVSRALKGALRDALMEDALNIISEMGRHAERFCKHAICVEALRQFLMSQANRTLDPADGAAVDKLVMANKAEMDRLNLPMLLQQQVLAPRGPATYVAVQAISDFLGLLATRPRWSLDLVLDLYEEEDEDDGT